MSRDAKRPSIQHRVEYTLFAAAVAVGRVLGDAAASRLGAAVGRLGYWPLGIRRKLVEAQLAAAFPDRNLAWIRSTARAAYEHLGRETMAMLRLAGESPERIIARTEIHGLEAMRAAVEAGRGAVLVTGHLGNWEIGGAALAARGLPLDVVAQRQANPLFDRAIVRARERLGMRVIERSQATRQAPRSLRAGRVVAFVADQDAKAAGEFVPFFGRLASTHRGPAILAMRTGAPLFLATCVRRGSGYRIDVRLIGEASREGGDEAVHALTAEFTAGLEAAIRAAPDQYLWHHRRWKTRPPEEPAPGESGIGTGRARSVS